MKKNGQKTSHFSPGFFSAEKKAARQQKWKTIAVFLAKFFAIYFALQFLILVIDLSFLENGLAAFQGQWVGAMVEGNQVVLKEGIFEINAQCTGLVSGIILAAVVFSLKKPDWKTKFKLWVMGAAALFLLNIARVYIVLVVARQYGLYWAEIVHQVSWFSTAVFILGIWLLLSKRMAKVKSVSELVE